MSVFWWSFNASATCLKMGASNKKKGSGAQRQTPLLIATAADRTVSPRGDVDLNRVCVHQKKLGSAERFSSIQTKQK
jgi:hypothetical protein